MSEERSGERTERATPKKRKEARERGQIFKSADLVAAFSMLVLFGTLSLFGSFMLNGFKRLYIHFLSGGAGTTEKFSLALANAAFKTAVIEYLIIMLPVLAVAFAAAMLFNYLQVGFLFAPKALEPKFSRISMIEGFKRIFSKKTLIELIKSLIRLAVLAKVAYDEYNKQLLKIPVLMQGDLLTAADTGWRLMLGIGLKLALALAILAPFDYLYQWWRYEKDLMMTKQEVRDEYKLTEGDPQIKGRIRQKQRQMSSMRMMQAVAEADVVITNPTELAVALSYKEGKTSAPVVVAKGQDYIAKKIREEAKLNNIELVENKPVARQLYYMCDIGSEVPEELYQAVAEILAYVYRLKHPQGEVKR